MLWCMLARGDLAPAHLLFKLSDCDGLPNRRRRLKERGEEMNMLASDRITRTTELLNYRKAKLETLKCTFVCLMFMCMYMMILLLTLILCNRMHGVSYKVFF